MCGRPWSRASRLPSKSGRPISAKFEMDDGEVAFSIYVDRSDGFREIVIKRGT
jgi:hypothetical protein